MIKEPTRAILYARVSSDDTTNQGGNLADQLRLCREYAEAKGWAVIDEVSEGVRGASRARTDLAGLERVLNAAEARRVRRAGGPRDGSPQPRPVKQLVVEDQLRRSGVRIEYVLGDYPDTPEGDLMKNVRAVVSQYETAKTRERTTRARRPKVREAGTMTHGRPSIGYSVTRENGHERLEIDEREAEIVRRIYRMYVHEGLGMRTIAMALNDEQIPPPAVLHGRQCSTHGGRWNQVSVGNVLRNETYAGRWTYGDTERTVEVSAIVDEATWRAVEARRAQNSADSPRNARYQNLLRRRVVCGSFGYAMTCIARRRRRGKPGHTYCRQAHFHRFVLSPGLGDLLRRVDAACTICTVPRKRRSPPAHRTVTFSPCTDDQAYPPIWVSKRRPLLLTSRTVAPSVSTWAATAHGNALLRRPGDGGDERTLEGGP